MNDAFNNGWNGQPATGQGYDSWGTLDHLRGQGARAAAEHDAATAAASKAGILQTASAISIGRLSKPNIGGKISWVLLIMGALYGVQDGVRHRASPVKSAEAAYGYTSAISDHIGQSLRKLGPDSTFVSVLNGGRWILGFAVAVHLGLGAGAGSGVVWATREITGG